MAIRNGQIEQFLQHAIRSLASDAPAMLGGAAIRSIEIDESHNVRVNLSDGSLFYVEVNHMVPRDYFKDDVSRGFLGDFGEDTGRKADG